MRSSTILFLLITVVLFSCKEKKSVTKMEVTGTVKNIDGLMAQYPGTFPSDSLKLVLYEVPFGADGQPVQLDSAYVTKKNPKFELSAQTSKQSLFDVMIENGPMMPLINDKEAVELDIDLTSRNNYYTASGSPASKKLRDFIFGYTEKSIPAGNAFKALDSLKATNSNDSTVIAATEEKNRTIESLNTYIRKTVNDADNPLVAAFTLGMASRTFSQGEYDSTLTQVIAKYPTDPSLQYLKNQLQGAQQQAGQGEQIWTGKPAPDMTMPDVTGKEVALSSFKGKYVLVDFWASWCGPCRLENPNVVKAYQAYKNKNFTIVGVSLDKDKENWLAAIQKDKLTWTHISDLAYWNSKSVEIFKFQGIPYNILIDPNGVVIGESLRGDQLISKLNEVLK